MGLSDFGERVCDIAAEVKAEFGIPKDKRVILYAPTWRDNQFYAKAKYKFTLALDLERMRKEFGKDSVLLLRTHYYIADILDLTGLGAMEHVHRCVETLSGFRYMHYGLFFRIFRFCESQTAHAVFCL